MTGTTESEDAPNWELYLFPNGKRAQICCRIEGASGVRELPGRLARLIVLLQQAMVEDARLPSDLKGFRNARELAKVFDENRRVDPPLASTITTYTYKLCRILKSPAAGGKSLPPLISRVKNSGARLLHPVKIHLVGRAPSDASEPAPSSRQPLRPADADPA